MAQRLTPFRLLSILLAAAALALTSPSRDALAKGAPLRGQEVAGSLPLTGQTGACQCDIRWYTVGLRPGPVRIRASLRTCGMTTAPSCELEVLWMRGGTVLKQALVPCTRSSHACRAQSTISYRVRKRGPFYLRIHGLGSEGILYSVRIYGAIYPLRCKRYCT